MLSLKLESPRKIVALARVDNSAPIRKDTIVGLEFQGLTGMAAISLTGGAAAAPPVPLDADGVPTLTADLSEIQSIRDTLHNVDRLLVSNQTVHEGCDVEFRDLYRDPGEQVATRSMSVMRKADAAFDGFDSAMAKIDNVMPGLANGRTANCFKR